MVALKQRLSSVEHSRHELESNLLMLYRVSCRALAHRDAEILRLNSR